MKAAILKIRPGPQWPHDTCRLALRRLSPAVDYVHEHVLTGYSRGTQGVLRGTHAYPPAVDHVHEHVRVAQVVEESVSAPAPLPPPQSQDVERYAMSAWSCTAHMLRIA
jgi:hypothetical protein